MDAAELRGIKPNLTIKRPFQFSYLGTAVELYFNGKTYTFISATTGNKLVDEIYPSSKSHLKVIKAEMIHEDLSSGWIERFDINLQSDLVREFPTFDSERYLGKVCRSSTKKNYKRALGKLAVKMNESPVFPIVARF